MRDPAAAPRYATNPSTVVLLHSLGTDRRLWRHQIPALAGDHDVLTPETRGHGTVAWPGEASVDGWVADLDRVIDGRDSVHLVGLSLGGIQAIAYAAAHPEKVRSLVIANSFACLPADVAEIRVRAVADGIGAGMAAYADRYLDQTLTRAIDEDDRAALRHAIASVSPDAYLATAAATFRADVTPWLPAIHCPTLVLSGELDEKAPLERSREIADGIDGAVLEVIAEAGHLSCVENPSAFNEAVTRFLHAVDASSANARRSLA